MADFNLKNGLRTYLLADGTIAGLVGTRIYPDKFPQTLTLPAVRMIEVVETRAPVIKGPRQFAQPLIQFSCYDREASGVDSSTRLRTLTDAIRRRLDGYVGLLTDASTSPASTAHVGIAYDSGRDLPPDPDVTGAVFGRAMDFRVGYDGTA